MCVRRLMTVSALVTGLVLLGATTPVWAIDTDGDGVDDPSDLCDNTPPGTAVDAQGRPLGDVDRDCDTDLEDHALGQQGFTGPLLSPTLVIDTVPIGNPGNEGELSGSGAGGEGPDRICGAVDYVYNIGKFEVTARQYTEFLNAVAGDDTYGLYDTLMWSHEYGCKIERTGSPPTYTYSVALDWADRPVNFVTWGDAARFANWLHNGQPAGAQDLTTTEDGSYFLNGATSGAALMAVVREPDATWVIPSEDEWYKAAYHCNDGVTGNYFDYPTSSNSTPSNELAETIDPGNNATFYDGVWPDPNGFTIGAPYYRTQAGAHENSDSPYGTFDQGGNVMEWNEGIIIGGENRGCRGGFFGLEWQDFPGDWYLHAAARPGISPTAVGYILGFRVAELP